MIYVEQNDGHGKGFVVLGSADVSVPAPYLGAESDDTSYGITWVLQAINDVCVPIGGTDYKLADKYSNSGFDSAGEYDPGRAYEHILIYTTYGIYILSLSDYQADSTDLLVSRIPVEFGAQHARIEVA